MAGTKILLPFFCGCIVRGGGGRRGFCDGWFVGVFVGGLCSVDDDLALVITLELVFNLRFWITKQDIFGFARHFLVLTHCLAGLLYFYVLL